MATLGHALLVIHPAIREGGQQRQVELADVRILLRQVVEHAVVGRNHGGVEHGRTGGAVAHAP